MFIVFEGIDGSGKTTLSNQVAERLKQAGLSVKHVRAEGKFASPVSEAIRTLARDSRNLMLTPRAEFLLYVARDVQLIEEAIRPALESHDVVIADRFLFTAEALGTFGRGLDEAYVAPVIRAAAGELAPDLVVLVDVDPVLARARRRAQKLKTEDKKPPSRKGLSGVGLQQRLRRGYLRMAEREGARWLVLSNEGSLEENVAQLTELLKGLHEKRAGKPTGGDATPVTLASQRALPHGVDSLDAALARFTDWVKARAEREPAAAAYVLAGLYGPPLDALRTALLERAPEVVLNGLNGLTDELSWTMRERSAQQYPRAVARSLGGLASSHPRAGPLFDALWTRAAPELLRCLSGRDDARSWELRARAEPREPALVASLSRLSSEQAWALRDAFMAEHGERIDEQHELGKALAKSLHGLDDPRAWALRERLEAKAPVSFLSSLSGLTCEASFDARERYLRQAPKPVMASLQKLDHPRAWALRRAVADHTKEALDGMAGSDAPEAWALREAYQDVWPSTVVKSLGVQADSPRGKELLLRQLKHHGHDISLLKHASSVALGNHRLKRPEE